MSNINPGQPSIKGMSGKTSGTGNSPTGKSVDGAGSAGNGTNSGGSGPVDADGDANMDASGLGVLPEGAVLAHEDHTIRDKRPNPSKHLFTSASIQSADA